MFRVNAVNDVINRTNCNNYISLRRFAKISKFIVVLLRHFQKRQLKRNKKVANDVRHFTNKLQRSRALKFQPLKFIKLKRLSESYGNY